MDACKYKEVSVDAAEERTEIHSTSLKPLLRQLFISSGVFSIYFVLGLSFGAPTVFIPQIRKEENSTLIDDDMASWLSSVHGYSAVPWIFIIPVFSQRFGRKIPFLIVCINTLVGFIVLYCSTNAVQILISEIMQGMLLASNITLLIVIITEYTSSRHRGFLVTFESAVFFWGVWVANLIGTFSHWKNIAIIAFSCSVYSLSAVAWPESPSWLAMKGRFDECAASHHWLKGFDKDSENELENLINSQKEYLKICAEQKGSTSRNWFRSVKQTASCKAFYKPLLLCITYMSLYHFSGKFVCSMYAVDLIKTITDNETAAYVGMLILDAITIISMQIGCVLSKHLGRRTLLLGSSVMGIIFLFIMSLYLFLVNIEIIAENKIVSILFLTSFSVSIACGPMILLGCLFGELVFLRYKSTSLLILTLYSEVLMATILKLSPHMFTLLSLYGSFLFYGVTASIFTFIMYKYLPETKDKSLHEIEAYFQEPKEREDVSKELIDENKRQHDKS